MSLLHEIQKDAIISRDRLITEIRSKMDEEMRKRTLLNEEMRLLEHTKTSLERGYE